MAKVVIVKGSPRRSGNSAILADQVAAGAEAAGATVESFYLHGMDIQPCDACDSCQGVADIDCVIEDDMQTLYPKLRAADANAGRASAIESPLAGAVSAALPTRGARRRRTGGGA